MISWLFPAKYSTLIIAGDWECDCHAHNSWKPFASLAAICAKMYPFIWIYMDNTYDIYISVAVAGKWKMAEMKMGIASRISLPSHPIPAAVSIYFIYLSMLLINPCFCLHSDFGSVMSDEVFMGLTALPFFIFIFLMVVIQEKAICSSFNLAGKAIRYHSSVR